MAMRKSTQSRWSWLLGNRGAEISLEEGLRRRIADFQRTFALGETAPRLDEFLACHLAVVWFGMRDAWRDLEGSTASLFSVAKARPSLAARPAFLLLRDLSDAWPDEVTRRDEAAQLVWRHVSTCLRMRE